jgi:hypothetical protein
VEVALARLIEAGVVKVDSMKDASYPMFDAVTKSASSKSYINGAEDDVAVRVPATVSPKGCLKARVA